MNDQPFIYKRRELTADEILELERHLLNVKNTAPNLRAKILAEQSKANGHGTIRNRLL